MSAADYQWVSLQNSGFVTTISLNNPPSKNALTDSLSRELLIALRAAAQDQNSRVVVLRGEGDYFCVGADLKNGQDEEGNYSIASEWIAEVLKPIVMTIKTMDKPVIGAVQGSAAGGGAAIAMACDLLVMSEQASLALIFSNIGLAPDCGASWLMLRGASYQQAFEIIAEGKKIHAEQCLSLGFANKVVAQASLDSVTLDWAERLAERAPLALTMSKRALNYACAHNLDETIDYEAGVQDVLMATHDVKEAFSAFLQKRKPVFSGR